MIKYFKMIIYTTGYNLYNKNKCSKYFKIKIVSLFGILGYLGCACCENLKIYLSYFQINNFCADLQIIYYDNITNIFESISSCNLSNNKYFK